MQCASCRFQNIPGVQACGRCGSPLGLATAVLDVHPPRAGRWRKQVRRLLPWGRAAAGAREALRGVGRHAGEFTDFHGLPVPPAGVLLRLPVPGWAHFHLGERSRGWAVVGLYLALLVPALVLMGTVPGSLLLGLAFSVHASSTLSILFRYGAEAVGRALTGVVVLACLALGVYVPVGWLVGQVARPVTIQEAGPPLAPDDVLLVNRSAYLFSAPRPGDVVLYQSGGFQIAGGERGPYPVQVAGGERIDRILAGPGAEVRWEGGRLFVDGAESPLRPLNPSAAPGVFSAHVPPGSYLIIPTTLPRTNANAPPDVWTRICVVPAQNIEGAVLLRTHPFARFGRLR
jgi:hypothetical protein